MARDARQPSSSSACTAWARRCTRSCARREGTRCRIYAPVGAHSDLLAYLVRRLLENGANSSFVHQIDRRRRAAGGRSRAIRSQSSTQQGPAANPAIPLPAAIFGAGRAQLARARPHRSGDARADRQARRRVRRHGALVGGADRARVAVRARERDVRQSGPGRRRRRHGARDAVPARCRRAVARRRDGAARLGGAAGRRARRAPAPGRRPLRGQCRRVLRAARRARPARRWPTPSRKCARRSISCATTPAEAAEAPRPTTSARGVFVCISPWNFPLAIFTGQVAAALAAGNAVIAKPAEQTPLIAARAVGAAARGRRARGRAAAAARRRAVGRRGADRRPAHRRRLLHRLDRRRQGDRPRAGRDRVARRAC